MMTKHSGASLTATAISLLLGFSTTACKKEEGARVDDKKATPDVEAPKTVETPAPRPGTESAPAGAPALAEAAGQYNVDASHSSVVFRTMHFGASYTYGMFRTVEGTVKIDPDLAKSEIALEVDASSVYSGDQKRDEHLMHADFLNVKQFPKITFKSKAIKAAGPGKYEVTGDLTLHGVTTPITAVFDHLGLGAHAMDPTIMVTGFHGAMTIKRSDFGMNQMVGPIGDEIHLMVSIEAHAKK